ncbi:MAG: DUF2924 domain-containing protein [Alphaproteobacteria bacterium]|nr:DUF2924 domain-containing protein [Alphaproteobacteria bacterium]
MTRKKIKVEPMDAQLAVLETMPLAELRILWQQYFKSAAPSHYQRGSLARRVGYQMQVAAYGGLSKTARLKLKRLGQNPGLQSPARYAIPIGTRILKQWRGREIIVLAESKRQFQFESRTYKSLSAIASELVGCRQSGNKFFGLHKKRYVL